MQYIMHKEIGREDTEIEERRRESEMEIHTRVHSFHLRVLRSREQESVIFRCRDRHSTACMPLKSLRARSVKRG